MSAPPFTLFYTDEALSVIKDLEGPAYIAKLKKVKKTLRLLRGVDPSHPALNSHKYQSISGPDGEDVWESYMENQTPGAWRLWWAYGPNSDAITIITLRPHP